MNLTDKIDGYLNESKELDSFKSKLNTLLKKAGSKWQYDDMDSTKYQTIFKKLNKKDGQELLDLATKAKEFHPDRIKQYQNIIGGLKESEVIQEADHTKEAIAFMKYIKSKIDKSISELENDKFGGVGSVTPSLVGKMAGINNESWYRGLFK